MIKKRIIPIILLDGFSAVKTINFKTRRNIGSIITALKTFNTRNVDELILLDIDASRNNRSIDFFTVMDIAKECFMPLTIGGGLRTVDDIEKVLFAGADKVSLNTEAIKNPKLINDAAKKFGSQSVVGSIDILKQGDEYFIYHQDQIYTDKSPLDWAKELESMGAGELLINSVNLDGTLEGGDRLLAEKISENVNIPVIYSGGVSSPEDCHNLCETDISGLGISSLFFFTGVTPNECKQYLHDKGISVRLK
ncbi:imidazole glycerol phosphate synthase cyclase subunit [Halobacteriovorax marinus]|uniref:imidazole glycerol-phosphate synthase n=1 Tax=Halobacteriovorax marinus TaxID=97084 RepID=A0A1Y5FGM2_9BACT|nr:imidazole glycerol phosphate synthase cyclase subunit [Halobacteriovorax marinus]